MMRREKKKVLVLALVSWLLLLAQCEPLMAAFSVTGTNMSVLVGARLLDSDTAALTGGLAWDSGRRYIYGWTSTSDTMTWNVFSSEAHTYEVAMIYSTFPYTCEPGSVIELSCGTNKVTGTTRITTGMNLGSAFERVYLDGSLRIPAGNNTVALRCTYKAGGGSYEVMRLFSVELISPEVKSALAESGQRARNARASTDWMVAAKYGLMVHWVGPTKPHGGGQQLSDVYHAATSNFNVSAFVSMVEETGAGYVLFHHGTGNNYPAPISAWEEVRGAGTTTKRDLIGEIAEGLHSRGIKFISGYSFDVPGNVWAGVSDFPARWMKTMKEISNRYGERIDGYFFDGGWFELYPYSSALNLYPYTGPWEQMFNTTKEGNPNRISTYNFYVYPLPTEWLEYWTGESSQNFTYPMESRYIQEGAGQGLQSHVMFPIDDNYEWFHSVDSDIGPPKYRDEDLINYITACNVNEGVMSLNVAVYQDGTMGPSTLQQLRTIRSAITAINNATGATNVTATSAEVLGRLVSPGGFGTPTDVMVLWGEYDATNNAIAWAHTNYFGAATSPAEYTTNITGLTPSTTYYYRYYATNSQNFAWGCPSEVFTTGGSAAGINNAGGATGLTAYTAWLNGTLTSTGASAAAVFLYWGATDGGNNKAAWARTNYFGNHTAGVPFTYSFNVTDLTPSTTYYYRYYVTNSQAGSWASSTSSFTTPPPPFEPSSGLYKMKISFSGYNLGETLVNFPALIRLNESLSGFQYSQFKVAGGGDLRITDSVGTELNYEIEEWNTSGTSVAWVQVPALANSSTYIWAYWGNAGAGTPGYSTNGATWSQGFKGVWHLNGMTSGSRCPDSTDGKNNGINTGADNAAGLISGGKYFNGADFVTIPVAAFSTISSQVTVSAWQYGGVVANNFFFDGGIPGLNRQISANLPWDTSVIFYNFASDQVSASTGGRHVGQWSHWVFIRDGGTARIYVNGSELASASGKTGTYTPLTSFKLGSEMGGTYNYDGLIDEFEVSDVARSANWIKASWMNQSSNTAFVTYGAVSESGETSSPYGVPEDWLQAKGLTNYVGVVAAETDDPDHDGVKTWQEYYAGTDPTNSDSKASGLSVIYSNGIVLVKFHKILATGTGYLGLNRYYDFQSTSNLISGTWLPVSTNILGNGGDFVHTNVLNDASKFYRTKARLK